MWKFLKTTMLALGLSAAVVGAHAQTCLLRDNGDGTMTAPYSGIQIQKCAVGQQWGGARCTGSPTMLTYNEAVTRHNQGSWRLITIEEGEKVRLETGGCPEFAVVQGTLTSSTDVTTRDRKKYARIVNFFHSHTDGNDLDKPYPVRLVKSGRN